MVLYGCFVEALSFSVPALTDLSSTYGYKVSFASFTRQFVVLDRIADGCWHVWTPTRRSLPYESVLVVGKWREDGNVGMKCQFALSANRSRFV